MKDQVKSLIIPLAGSGTRFTPSSTIYPKELTHLVDKPVIQYIIEEAYQSGIREVIFVITKSKSSIEKYFSQTFQEQYARSAFSAGKALPEDLERLHKLIKEMNFKFIKVDSTLGDGHSIFLAKKLVKDKVFAVSMGDLLSSGKDPFLSQLIKIYEKNNTPVISVERIERKETYKYGVIATGTSIGRKHEVKTIVEKPKPEEAPSTLILTGKYILTQEIFEILKRLLSSHRSGELRLSDALKVFAESNQLLAYECNGKIQDTGNKHDFLKATINFALNNAKYRTLLKRHLKDLDL